MNETCTFCGGKPRGWCGPYAWCSSAECHQRYLNATYEPCFELYRPRTPLGIVWAWFMARVFRAIAWPVPARWILMEGARREGFAIWLFGNWLYWEYASQL